MSSSGSGALAQPPDRSSSSSSGATDAGDKSKAQSPLLWLFASALPCIGGRNERPVDRALAPAPSAQPAAALQNPMEEQPLKAQPRKARPTQITVHTSTPGGVQEKRCFSRDATVYDLRCSSRIVNGKQYKLISIDGRQLDDGDSLTTFLDDVESPDLHLTKVSVAHPVDLDMLYEIEASSPKKDVSKKSEVFPLGFLQVSMGLEKFSNVWYTSMNIDDPQPAFRAAGKLEPYRLGYDHYDQVEAYNREGRHGHRMLPSRKEEMENELKLRLPEFHCVNVQVFTDPNRIHKLRAFLDKDSFPPTRENLHRFLNVFFDILTDKSALLL